MSGWYAGRLAIASVLCLASALALEARDGQIDESERQRIVEAIEFLETTPVGSYAETRRNTVAKWLTANSDLQFTVYLSPLRELFSGSSRWREEKLILFKQVIFSTARYHLEHPGADPDNLDAVVAGVDGALSAYEQLRRQRKKFSTPLLDSYLRSRDDGGLRDRIAQEIREPEDGVLILVGPETLTQFDR